MKLQLLGTTPRREPSPRAGFTLVELIVAITVMVVAMLGTMATITSTTMLGESSRESTIAYQAARSMIESIQSEDHAQVFARYNVTQADDPDATAPGPSFTVPGLNTQAGDADGFVGRVVLPISAGSTLREDRVDADFGLPRDLNGDGAVDGLDHSVDYVLLPMRVRVEWSGVTGDRFIEFETLIGAR